MSQCRLFFLPLDGGFHREVFLRGDPWRRSVSPRDILFEDDSRQQEELEEKKIAYGQGVEDLRILYGSFQQSKGFFAFVTEDKIGALRSFLLERFPSYGDFFLRSCCVPDSSEGISHCFRKKALDPSFRISDRFRRRALGFVG